MRIFLSACITVVWSRPPNGCPRSNLIGLLVFQVFSRMHDSVADQSAFFDYAVAVAAEAVGLAVPLEGSRREAVNA
ncbi:hypothetical protein AB0F91_05615 [Amycolatopsis sp. NPDC023774]|uniref:hypothetical protein n=1 Tax=Amycolatopsis sp. NPDC023774 TaxID=3155015 RepID=UPI0033D1CA65